MTDIAAATASMVGATRQLVNTKAEVLDWAVGTVDGGPSGNGTYPFTAADGTIVLVPTPEKIAAMNGDPTAAAATLDAKVAAATAAAQTATAAAAGITNLHFGVDLLADADFSATIAVNGAVLILDAGGRPVGWTIPVNAGGVNSELYAAFALDGSLRVGDTIAATLTLDVGADPTRNYFQALQIGTGDGNWTNAVSSYTEQLPTTLKLQHVCDGSERAIRVALVQTSGAPNALEAHVRVTGLAIEWVGSANPAVTPMQLNAAELRARAVKDALAQASEAQDADTAAEIEAAVAPLRISTGDLLTTATPRNQLLGGAVAAGSWGGTIPAGNSGAQVLIQPVLPFSGAGNAGKTIKLTTGYAVDAAISRGFIPVMQLKLADGSFVIRPSDITASGAGTRRAWSFTYVVQGDEAALGAFVLTAAGSAPQDDTITLTDIGYVFTATTSPSLSPADETMFARLIPITSYVQLAKDRARQSYETTVLVRADGTGDFTHPKLALDAIGDASSGKRYAILVEAGTYNQYAEWHTKDYVDLVALGRRQDTVLTYGLPDSASADQINNTSTLWLDTRSRLIGLTISVRNGRYAIHRETNGAKVGNKSAIIDCWVQHFGNPSPNNNWASRYAVGAGNSSGEVYDDERSIFVGIDGAFSYHQPNNANYAQPTLVRFRDCGFVSTGGAAASNGGGAYDLFVKVLRPGAGDACVLDGCSLATLAYYDREWQVPDTTTPRNTIRVLARGCTPFAWTNTITAAPGGNYRPEYLALAA